MEQGPRGERERPRSAILTIPNVLSILRLASVPVFVTLFVTGREEPALLIYAVGAWTDFFDGYIARRTGSVTELGKILDPLADRVFIVALVVALVGRGGVLPLPLALAVVARDVIVLSLFPLLERRGITRIPVSLVGKAATGSLFMGLTLLTLSVTRFSLPAVGPAGLGFTIFGAVLYWIAGIMYGREVLKRLRGVDDRGTVVA